MKNQNNVKTSSYDQFWRKSSNSASRNQDTNTITPDGNHKSKTGNDKETKNHKTKHDDDYLLTKINHKVLVEARPFTTAKTNNMYNYLQPTLRNFNADLFIIHIGRNDASLNKRNKEIVQNFVKLAASIVTNIKNVAVSNIDPREYNYKMKVEQINKIIDEVWKKTYSFD